MLATSAHAAWALVEVEVPIGSDSWTIAKIPRPTFLEEEQCQRHARDLQEMDKAVARMEHGSAEAHARFACLPDYVDPREGERPSEVRPFTGPR